MPFQSEKQRRYLWANEPEIARDWTDTYGSGIAKALGGRIPFANGTILPQRRPYNEDLINFPVSGADLTGQSMYDQIDWADLTGLDTSGVYTQAFDASRPYGKKMDASMRGLEFMMPQKRMQLDLGDTLGGGIHRIPLDTPQGYQSNIRHGTGTALLRDKIANWIDPGSTSMTPWGENKKMRDPNLLARIAGQVGSQAAGALNENIIGNFFSNPKQTLEDYLANYSGRNLDYYTSPDEKASQLAEYLATSDDYIPNKLAEMASQNWKSFDKEDLAKNIIQPDGSVMTMGPNFNYGDTQAAPTNIKAPFMNPNVSDPSVMQPHDFEFGNQWLTAEEEDESGNWLANLKQYTMPAYNFMRGNIGAGLMGLWNPLAALTMFAGRNRGPVINPATRQFMNQYNVGRNPQTGRMTSGPFAGRNLPGTSMFGSKTPQQMAQNWMGKYGSMDYNTERQIAKQKEIRDIAAGNTNLPPSERTVTPTRTHTPSGPTRSPHRDQPHGTDTSGSFAGKGSGNPFGRARGGLAGLWPR